MAAMMVVSPPPIELGDESPFPHQICLATSTTLMASYAAKEAADYPPTTEDPVVAGRQRLGLEESALSPLPPSTSVL